MSEQRAVLCELLRSFHALGWATGTGGGICALEAPDRLLLAPTGVHKERVRPDDLFVVDVPTGDVVEPAADPSLRPSECKDVFRQIIIRRQAGAVLHTHALSAVLAWDMGSGGQLAIEGLEMLKGIPGLENSDTHLVPIVANTPHESEIVEAVADAVSDERFSTAWAVGVRDHGAYIWGRDIWECKKHAEVYHYLFEAVRERRR